MTVVRQYVQESSNEIKTFTCNIGDLEYRAYSLADELGRRLYGLFTVFNEDWNFPSSLRLEDAGKLGDSLLKYLWRADVNFGDDNHDRYIDC